MLIIVPQRIIAVFTVVLCFLMAYATEAQVPAYVPADNLVAWYGLNGTAADGSSNSFDGNLIGVTPAPDRSGNSNGAFFFNGLNSEITVPFHEAFNAFPFSVSLWCKLEQDESGSMLIQRYNNSSWNGWVLSMSGTNEPEQTVSPGYMLQSPPSCNGVVSSGQCGSGINYLGNLYDHHWHMLTFTVDGDSGRFYVDDQIQTSQAWMGQAGPPTGVSDLRIGGTDMGSSYFFHGAIDDVGLWNRALTSEEISILYNSLPPIAGCTNTNACNYAQEATINDGSCVFDCEGCIDPCACNYNQNAAVNDGTCDYSCNVGMTFITVFYDANANGVFDNGESPMQYWPVHIEELQKVVYTDQSGMVIVPLPAGAVHYQLIGTTEEWVATTPIEAELVVPGNAQALFGLTHSSGFSGVEAEVLPGYYAYMHCQYGMESGVYLRNTGGQLLHGTLTLTCDAFYTPGMPLSMSTPPSVSGPGFAQWNIQNLRPWETRLLAFHLDGPGSALEGQAMSFVLNLELYDAQGNSVYSDSFFTLKDIQCEEQPARLHSDPIGIDEAFHYVPEASTITFRAQFQNTTADWADDALIIQNLNSQQFDLSSFELMYASEALVGCLHDDGTIDLQFSNLGVAPTGEDPTQAGGYAVYRVRLRDDIPADSTFYHNMHVVYDMNTNSGRDSVYHTIYDCSRLAHVVGDELYCEGDTVVLQSDGAWIEQYRWLLGETLLSTEASLHMPFEPGFYNVACQFSNPVCYVCEHKPIHIIGLPEGNVTFENGWLETDTDYFCQWYVDGSAIDGATQTSWPISSDGVYQVQWTSEEGCTSFSDQYVINAIEAWDSSVELFPNPAMDEVCLAMPPGIYDIAIYDANGKLCFSQGNASNEMRINVASLSSGLYTVCISRGGAVMRGLLRVR